MYLLKRLEFKHTEEMNKLLTCEKKTVSSYPGLNQYLMKLDNLLNQLQFGIK